MQIQRGRDHVTSTSRDPARISLSRGRSFTTRRPYGGHPLRGTRFARPCSHADKTTVPRRPGPLYIYKAHDVSPISCSVQFPAFLRASARTALTRGAHAIANARASGRILRRAVTYTRGTRPQGPRTTTTAGRRGPRQVRSLFFAERRRRSRLRGKDESRKKLVGIRVRVHTHKHTRARGYTIPAAREISKAERSARRRARPRRALLYPSPPRAGCPGVYYAATLASVEDYFIIRAGLAAVMVCILNISKIAFLGNSSHNGNTWNIIPG